MRQRKIAKPRVHCCGALRIVQRSALLVVGWLPKRIENGDRIKARDFAMLVLCVNAVFRFLKPR